MSTGVSYPQAGSPGAVCVSLAPVSHHRALFTSEISLSFSGYSSSLWTDVWRGPAWQAACFFPPSTMPEVRGIYKKERCRLLTLSSHISLGRIWTVSFPEHKTSGLPSPSCWKPHSKLWETPSCEVVGLYSKLYKYEKERGKQTGKAGETSSLPMDGFVGSGEVSLIKSRLEP